MLLWVWHINASLNVVEPIQKDDVAGDLDASMEEFQEWLQEMETGLRDLQRDLGKLDRDILSKKQLIEANKAQYTRVGAGNATGMKQLVLLLGLLHDVACKISTSAGTFTWNCRHAYSMPA